MPYIKKYLRNLLDKHLPECGLIGSVGELNYFITKVILKYWGKEEPNYADYNEVVGVLEAIKLELYRRVISKYEDKKIKENGDVYE